MILKNLLKLSSDMIKKVKVEIPVKVLLDAVSPADIVEHYKSMMYRLWDVMDRKAVLAYFKKG